MVDLRPRRILHLDLAAGLPPDGLDTTVGPLLVVVWWRDLPVGYEHLHRGASGTELAARFARLVAPSVGQRLLGDGYPQPRPGLRLAPPPSLATVLALAEPLRELDANVVGQPADDAAVTVAICTRDRPEALDRCLRSIAHAVEPPDEILVVDNAPHRSRTREVVERFPAARYVPEPRPGL